MKNTPLKILIADDDPDDLEYLKFLFQNHKSFEIIDCLSTGKQILDEILEKGNVPDVLITDMYMPLLTGAEAVQELLEKNAASMEIFIISTTINRTEEDKFGSNKNIKFLEKPVTLPQINDLPEIILEKLNLDNVNKI